MSQPFKFVPRSAVYGQTQHDPDRSSMPSAMPMRPNAGRPGTQAQAHAMPHAHQVELLKGAVVRLQQDRARIVKEANMKLGAMATKVRQYQEFIRTAYGPGVQVPGMPPVDVGVPTHALRNPYVATTDGGRGAPPAQSFNPNAGNPRDAAGAPGDRAQTVHESVRAAEDAIFYGEGDAAFYQGGEDD